MLVILLLASFYVISINNQNKKLKAEINNRIETIKSYENENSKMSDLIITQKRTIGELSASNDSINKELVRKIKELKIKDNKIKELQFLSQEATKVDSIYIRDSIFIHDFSLDTTISDKWYRLNMTLLYPNLIVINPTFNSELSIIKHQSKEYVDKPKKCWIGRLFQKKILVEKVDIIENNPYIKTKIYRDVDIIK
jgi:hypothetical protein